MDHVLTVILNKNTVDDAEYFNWIAYNKISDMYDLMDIEPAKMETIPYDNDGNMVLPLQQMVACVKILKEFNHFYSGNNNKKCMDNEDWMNVTRKEYNEFKIQDYNTYSPIQPNPSTTTTTGTSTKTIDPVADFKKGIKRDATHFPKFKDDAQWDNWNRDVITTARAQNVENVLNPNYRATAPADKDLFKEQQKFMYDVFTKTCLTDRSKSIVRKHFANFDAQKVYAEMEDYFTKSTKAKHSSSTLLTYLTSASITDGKWTGTTQAFILNWQNKLRLYNELKPPTQKLPDEMQLALLQNAVVGLQALRAVKDNEDNSFARTGINLTYDQYSELLLSAAESYDLLIAHKKGNKTATRGVYSTDIINEHDDDDELDIDSSIAMIEANFTRIASMPKNRWEGLPPEVRTLWDTLDDDSKAIILGNIDPKTKLPIDKSNNNNRRSSNRDSRTRSVNHHDTIRAFLAKQAEAGKDDDDTSDDNDFDEDKLESFTQTLLAFNASQAAASEKEKSSKATSPADIRSVLSQPSKKTTPKSTPSKVEVNEVTFNGSIYRRVMDGAS